MPRQTERLRPASLSTFGNLSVPGTRAGAVVSLGLVLIAWFSGPPRAPRSYLAQPPSVLSSAQSSGGNTANSHTHSPQTELPITLGLWAALRRRITSSSVPVLRR